LKDERKLGAKIKQVKSKEVFVKWLWNCHLWQGFTCHLTSRSPSIAGRKVLKNKTISMIRGVGEETAGKRAPPPQLSFS
jgi:hypothetical protein